MDVNCMLLLVVEVGVTAVKEWAIQYVSNMGGRRSTAYKARLLQVKALAAVKAVARRQAVGVVRAAGGGYGSVTGR